MTETKPKRKPRKYTYEFKQQLVDLYRYGKRRCDICREYDICHSLFDKWVKQSQNSGSFHEKDNRTPEQEELIKITEIFHSSRNNYGTRKIKKELEKQEKQVARCRIGRMMFWQVLLTCRKIPV